MFDPSLYKIYYIDSDDLNTISYLDGVTNLTIDKKVSFSENFSLGGAESAYIINSPQQLEVSFNSSTIRNDSLISFTGCNFICCFFFNENNYIYNINNLYLNSYSASFSVGGLPSINTKFTSYGSKISTVDHLPSCPTLEELNNCDIIKLNAISISGNNINNIICSYNILSFDYNLMINRQPYYTVGDTLASQVELVNPSKINFSITSKIKNTYRFEDVDFLSCAYSFSILISGHDYLIKYPIKNSVMAASSMISSSQNTLEIKRDYIGYLGV